MPSPPSATTRVGFKEVIELPPATIEDRWHLNPGEGAAHLFMGAVTKGMLGGGFLYTNKESISLGLVVGMAALKQDPDQTKCCTLLDEFKEMPQIKPLVAGGTVAEYSAHAIAEGGIAQVPRLYGDGYVLAGDTAGLSLNALVTVRGMDFAIASGYHAAAGRGGRQEGRRLLRRRPGRLRAVAASRASCSRTWRRRATSRASSRTRACSPTTRRPSRAWSRACSPSVRSRRGGSLATLWRGVRKDFLNVATLKDLWQMRKL